MSLTSINLIEYCTLLIIIFMDDKFIIYIQGVIFHIIAINEARKIETIQSLTQDLLLLAAS